MSTVIIGGGLAGLISAFKFPQATVYEAGKEVQQHRALLRFRSDEISHLTGVPFKEVSVQKGVWDGSKLITGSCGFDLQNQYSVKVSGNLLSRSIADLSPKTRWIAPDDFYYRLVEKLNGRIHFEHPITVNDIMELRSTADSLGHEVPAIINTAPLPVLLKILGCSTPGNYSMDASSIRVIRYPLKFDHADVYQTVYFPNVETDVYRASITGDTLIIEAMDYKNQPCFGIDLDEVLAAFGLTHYCLDVDNREELIQKNGKLVGLEKSVREAILYQLTTEYNIFSIGRFATWRNVLLDDVLHDLERVTSLISASTYKRHLLEFSPK